VLEWIAYGKTNAEIAAILGVGTRTIQSHCANIFGKLDVYTRSAAAVAWCLWRASRHAGRSDAGDLFASLGWLSPGREA